VSVAGAAAEIPSVVCEGSQWFVSDGSLTAEVPSGARDLLKRLIIALAAFVVLGILSWNTISDQRIRLATLAILAMFALKTWVRRKDVLHLDKD